LPNAAGFGYFTVVKRFAALAVLFLTLTLLPAGAQQGADDQYLIIYSLMQQADSMNSAGHSSEALAGFVEAQGELQKFQKTYPDWSPKIVNFRLNYLAEKIAELTPQVPAIPQSGSPQIPATNAPTAPTPTAPPPAAPTTTASPPVASTPAVPPATGADFEARLKALQAQVQGLQADNTTLEARLKEALATQPAMVDPRELARAQEQIRSLMKENDLLKVSLARGPGGTVALPGLDTNLLAQLRQALAEANNNLAEEAARADRLTQENQTLQGRVQALLASPAAVEALREENELLKKQLAELRAQATNAPVTGLNDELANARARISILQSNAEVSLLEREALENRVRQLESGAKPRVLTPGEAENEARIRELTQERDDLLAKLGTANAELYGRKKQDAAAQIAELTDEVNVLRARLAVDEARAVPYTPEELALFKQPAPPVANPNAGKKSIKELPGGTATLVAEAQHYFADRQYDKAEDDYLQILRHDENNGLVLANLAAIEIQQNKLDDAEKHVQAALTQAPDDAYNLSLLGYLKFQQGKYDDALNTLSHAARLDPQDPQIQNYLGVTLSHKGLRQQAETALRKAVQLDPNYAAAHNNLAVIYISQQPPLPELARWHYAKALAVGQPPNPDLEKMLAEKGAPVKAQ
jgi:tetratricopeptide (TPR) repeat protein